MGKKDTSTPDNSAAISAMSQQSAAAMMHQSDNMYGLGMAQIGSQMMQAQSMFNLGQAQIDSQITLGRERLQNSLEIARLNYMNQMDKQENSHSEKMAEMDLRKYEIDKEAEMQANQANSVGTDSFFS